MLLSRRFCAGVSVFFRPFLICFLFNQAGYSFLSRVSIPALVKVEVSCSVGETDGYAPGPLFIKNLLDNTNYPGSFYLFILKQ